MKIVQVMDTKARTLFSMQKEVPGCKVQFCPFSTLRRNRIISYIFLCILILLSAETKAQSNGAVNWGYFNNAIDSGVVKYMSMTDTVIFFVRTIKIISLKKNSGEIAIRVIHYNDQVDAANPSHCINIDGRTCICRTDFRKDIIGEKSNLVLLNDSNISIVYNVFPKNIVFGGQPPPVLYVKYRKNKLKYKMYEYIVPDKYLDYYPVKKKKWFQGGK